MGKACNGGGGGEGRSSSVLDASPAPPPGGVMSYSTTLEGFAFAFCTIATKSFLEKCHSYLPRFRMLSFDLCIMKAVLMVDIVVVRGQGWLRGRGGGGGGCRLATAGCKLSACSCNVER